jgi:hypothetical protein
MTALATLEVAALEKSELLRSFHVNGIGEEVESFLSLDPPRKFCCSS